VIENEPTGRGCQGEVFISSGSAMVSFQRGVKVVDMPCGYGQGYIIEENGDVIPVFDVENELEIDIKFHSMGVGKEFRVGIGLNDSRLYSWGKGNQGQLGLGHTRGSKVPELLSSVQDKKFVCVDCGEAHAAAVDDGGSVFSWGRGFEGQLGQGVNKEAQLHLNPSQSLRLVPFVVQGLIHRTITQVSCGDRFCCAIDSEGMVWSWGEGLLGQLGTGRCTYCTIPAKVIGPRFSKDDSFSDQVKNESDLSLSLESLAGRDFFVSVSCGSGHVLALDTLGKVTCWGFNAHGQLGLSDIRTRYTPTEFPYEGSINQIFARDHSSCAINEQGILLQWGGYTFFSPTEKQVGFSLHSGVWMDKETFVALVPTCASSISPGNGSLSGGEIIRVHGAGFWNGEDIKVRFIPLKRKEEEQVSKLNDTTESDSEDDSDDDSDSNIKEDPRNIEIVCGRFIEADGTIECVAPANSEYGVSLVQVAVDGETYTNQDVFYMYKENCEIISVSPEALCCSGASRVANIVVHGTGIISTPELCIRLRHGDIHLDLPGDFLNGDESSQQTTCVVNAQVLIQHFLSDFAESVVELAVSVSTNGIYFSPEVPLLFSHAEIVSCVPKAAANANSSITLSCKGLIEISNCQVRWRREDIVLVDKEAIVDVENQKITVKSPYCQLESIGFLEFCLEASFDEEDWIQFPDPFVFYNGAFASPVPLHISESGGNIITIPAISPGWFFESSELAVRFRVGENIIAVSDVTQSSDSLIFLSPSFSTKIEEMMGVEDSSLSISLEIAMNGMTFVPIQVQLYQTPIIELVSPKSIIFPTETTELEITIACDSNCQDTGCMLVLFSGEDSVQTSEYVFERSDCKRAILRVQIPTFSQAGLYSVSVSMNGIDDFVLGEEKIIIEPEDL